MNMLAGIAGLFQIVFLPGLILSKLLPLRGRVTERVLIMFPLSLIVNMILVMALTALHLYTSLVFSLFFCAELCLLAWLYRAIWKNTLSQSFRQNMDRCQQEWSEPFRIFPKKTTTEKIMFLIWLLSGAGAFSGILWALHLCRMNVGTVFRAWDTLYSWNAYAMQWAQGIFVLPAGSYPQLVPANWSISYLLQGADAVQFFNTILPPVFFLLLMAMMFDLGFRRCESGFFLGAIIARFMMKKLMGDGLFDGYMDVPAASMSFAAVYVFLISSEKKNIQKQSIFLGLAFAAGAAMTKQAGWVVLIFSPIVIALWLETEWKDMRRSEKCLAILLPALVVIPWYALDWVQNQGAKPIAEGVLAFNAQFEWSHKWLLVREALGKYQVVVIFAVAGALIVPRRYGAIFLLLSLPILLSWMFFFAYDTRNLASALPFLALLAGFTIETLVKGSLWVSKNLRVGRISMGVALLGIVLLVLGGLVFYFSDQRLNIAEREQHRNLFGSELNQELLYGEIGDTARRSSKSLPIIPPIFCRDMKIVAT